MKTLTLIFAAFFTLANASNAQTNHSNHSFICSYYGEAVSLPLQGFNSSSEAQQVIKSIIDVIGLEPKFQIRAAEIPNAAAVISSGQRFILYNPNFISAINQAANNKWASIAILAHEIGHHLNGHTLMGTGSRPSIELEADQFSGFVLRKMGATLPQAQLSMNIVANARASRTHPGKADRLVSIENGWNKAHAQMTGETYVQKSIPSANTADRPQNIRVNNSRFVLNERYIQYKLNFHNDAQHLYYITTNNNFVTIRENELLNLGKVVSTGNSNFPLAIRSGNKTAFYISRQGAVITPQRTEVGRVER